MTTVIAFGFMNRSGKDTAAAEIIKQRSQQYDVRRYGFADEMKKEITTAVEKAGNIVELFAQMDDQLPDWVTLEVEPDMTDPLLPYGKFRSLCQWWGGEYRRTQNPRYWIEKLEERILEEKPQVALIADMRYSNEMAWVKSTMDGYAVKIIRPDGPTGTGHQSEIELGALPDQAWSYILHNTELERFKATVLSMFDVFVGMKAGRDISVA